MGKPFAQRLGRGVLHLGRHRRAHPQPAGIDAVGALFGILAKALDQVAADLFHEISALLAKLGARAIADRAERQRCGGDPLNIGDLPVVSHFAQHIIAPVERLLGRALRIIIARRFGQNRQIGRLRQRQLVNVLVEIGAARGLHAVGVAPQENRI